MYARNDHVDKLINWLLVVLLTSPSVLVLEVVVLVALLLEYLDALSANLKPGRVQFSSFPVASHHQHENISSATASCVHPILQNLISFE